eukprot:sb/3469840/
MTVGYIASCFGPIRFGELLPRPFCRSVGFPPHSRSSCIFLPLTIGTYLKANPLNPLLLLKLTHIHSKYIQIHTNSYVILSQHRCLRGISSHITPHLNHASLDLTHINNIISLYTLNLIRICFVQTLAGKQGRTRQIQLVHLSDIPSIGLHFSKLFHPVISTFVYDLYIRHNHTFSLQPPAGLSRRSLSRLPFHRPNFVCLLLPEGQFLITSITTATLAY